MMNHCVPDFDIDEDCRFPTSSSAPGFRSRKSSIELDEVMELLWENGQVVMHRPARQHVAHQSNVGSSSGGGVEAPPLFIQEDEMASWLQYPIDDDPQFGRDFCSELLFPADSCAGTSVTDPIPETRPQPPIPAKPPIPPAARGNEEEVRAQGFSHFSRFRPRLDAVSAVRKAGKVSASKTVVESNATPLVAPMESKASQAGEPGRSSVGGDMETTSLDFTLESSSGASEAEPGLNTSANGDKKRKGREADYYSERPSQDVALKAADAKNQSHGSAAKRTRAAEVHNLSERRRRDRINEKMKALQELVPRCNKSDKASMLGDAIEYLKSLQMQLQMMSMGCGMVPMMFPGMQQYMQPMGMGMGVDLTRPMMPLPMTAPCHLGPRYPIPPYHPIPPFVAPDSSRIQVNNLASMLNPSGIQNAYQPQVQTIPSQYHQNPGCQTMQMQSLQNEANAQPNGSKPGPCGGPENPGPRSPSV